MRSRLATKFSLSIAEEEDASLLELSKAWADLDARREEVIALSKNGEGDKARTILLTAMKLWLFAIREAVERNDDLGRKLGIVSEEISRLESIVDARVDYPWPGSVRELWDKLALARP